MLQQVSEKLLGEFVDSLEAKLAGGHTEAVASPTASPNGPAPAACAGAGADRPARTGRRRCAQEVRAAGFRCIPVGGRRLHAGTAAHRAKGAAREAMTAPFLLRGVDLAAFAVALVNRLHAGGVVVSASGPAGFVEALRHDWPETRSQLYWAARLTLVNRIEDLAAFDSVFEAIFADAVLGVDPPGLKQSPGTTAARRRRCARRVPLRSPKAACPWTTRPALDHRRREPCRRHRYSRHAAEPDRRACGRAVRTIRSRGSPPAGRVAGTGGGALAAPTQPAPGAAPARQADRSPGDDEGIAHDGLGDDPIGSYPQPANIPAEWSLCATSADRCSRTPRSICISCGQRPCGRREFAPRSSRSRHR